MKPTEIDKAIYLDDDLNVFFKGKLQDSDFRGLFLDLFKYDTDKDEVLLKKIRQLLVIHKIPISLATSMQNNFEVAFVDTYISDAWSQSEPDRYRLSGQNQ